jgi:hypothetical protein
MHQRRRYAWDEPTLSGTLLGASVRLIVRSAWIHRDAENLAQLLWL